MEESNQLEKARALISSASKIVALTGAGMSTASNIPDYRGPNGLWTRNPEFEKLSNINYYLTDPEIRIRSWQDTLHSKILDASPNQAHRCLYFLEKSSKLKAIVTQNIDGLHQKAGNSDDIVVELHGNVLETICLTCENKLPTKEVLKRLEDGDLDPRCKVKTPDGYCGGILKTTTISFGQRLKEEVIEKAIRALEDADLLLCLGTTLSVVPAANLVPYAKSFDVKVMIINQQETQYDDLSDIVIKSDLVSVLPKLINL